MQIKLKNVHCDIRVEPEQVVIILKVGDFSAVDVAISKDDARKLGEALMSASQ